VNYPQVLEYLRKLGNEIQTMKFGLETTRAILLELGDPQTRYPSIIVAGTNGKGSTASFIHKALTLSGMNSGIFTSPHLERIEERIRINDRDISEEEFAANFTHVLDAALSLDFDVHPTFFELIACTALYSFANWKAEFAVLEVGMGGRLDSTNIVEPVLSVITSIGYDHQQYLGDTLSLIAAEKAGIMRRGVPVISALQEPEAQASLLREALDKGADLSFVSKDDFLLTGSRNGCYSFQYRDDDFSLGIPGIHQVENAVLALESLDVLGQIGWPVKPEAARQAIARARRPGVIEIVEGNPRIILDGGHNVEAAEALRDYIEKHVPGPATLVLGMMEDKDVAAAASILAPLFDRIFLVQVDSDRAMNPGKMKEYIPSGITRSGAGDALREAVGRGCPVVVAGSFYLAGEARSLLNSGKISGYSPARLNEPDCEPGC